MMSHLSMTQNLAEGMLHLQLHDKPRILWIDAICIDQDNIAERSRQVQMMTEIYQRAASLLTWLDPDQGDAALAFATSTHPGHTD
jgi:hypothetical protein